MQVSADNGTLHGQLIDGSGQHDLADIDLCKKINDVLMRHYPRHPWMVGVNHKTGAIHIELAYFNRLGRLFPYGFQLYIHKLGSAKEMAKKIMRAGGELLERFNLERRAASESSENIALLNGVNTTDMIL